MGRYVGLVQDEVLCLTRFPFLCVFCLVWTIRQLIPELLEEMKQHEYFNRSLPKTTGREVGDPMLLLYCL